MIILIWLIKLAEISMGISFAYLGIAPLQWSGLPGNSPLFCMAMQAMLSQIRFRCYFLADLFFISILLLPYAFLS